MDLEEIFPATIDSSMRADYAECPHKFYLRHVVGLCPASVNIHLNAGGAYAKGLETFRREYYSNRASYDDAVALGLLALLREYGDIDFDPKESKQWYAIVDAYLSYLRQWPPATDYIKPLITSSGEPSVEFSFAIPIDITHPVTGDPLLYSGRFDMLGVMNNTLFVVDDKTTGRLGATWSQQWDLRAQFTGYCWAAQQYDYPVAGAIIRGTAVLKTQINHSEAIVYRPEFVIQRWHDRLIERTQEMKNSFLSNYWPHDGEESGACSNYGGCAYRTLCASPNPSNWIEGNFTIYRWNPMKVDQI